MNSQLQIADVLNQSEAALELNLNPEMRIPKREVPAEVSFTFAPDRLRWCIFYLSFYSPRRHGEESLVEHLNSGLNFFPVRDRESKEFSIIHIDQILYVREAVLMELKTGRPLNLLLDHGVRLGASLLESRQSWPVRPIDLLNESERFITFVRDDHSRLHVNKGHIARVEGL